MEPKIIVNEPRRVIRLFRHNNDSPWVLEEIARLSQDGPSAVTMWLEAEQLRALRTALNDLDLP